MSASDSDWRDSIPQDVLLKQWNPILCNKCFSPSCIFLSGSTSCLLTSLYWGAWVLQHYKKCQCICHLAECITSTVSSILDLIGILDHPLNSTLVCMQFGSFWTISYVPFWTISNHIGPFQTILNHVGPSEPPCTVLDHIEPSWTIGNKSSLGCACPSFATEYP